MFVSFEGIDGSGKSTQAQLLAETLRQRNHEVVLVREPGGTDLGEIIRGLLLEPDASISPRAELLLFSAARAQLVDHVILPALKRGAVVIADRYIDSSTAYQGGGRGIMDLDWFVEHHSFVTGGVIPDRTYFFDLDPVTAASRRGIQEADRMESGGKDYYNRIRHWYRLLLKHFPDRILPLDGSLPVKRLHESVTADFIALFQAATDV